MSWRWLLLSLDILIDVLWRTPLDQQLNVEYDMRFLSHEVIYGLKLKYHYK